MLLQFTKKGIYCPKANVYIDPWRPVDRALITHGHADHSRWGHKNYLATHSAAPVIEQRLGKINLQTVGYGEKIQINGVDISFHPAGHIVGSAQIRIAYQGEIWVVSGDYKLEDDGVSEPFESVKCHTFITESTFGLPIYKWKEQQAVYAEINSWWRKNKEEGKTSILCAYALGKAQRIIQHLDSSIGPIFTHGAVENVNEVLRSQGVEIQPTYRVTPDLDKKNFAGSMVITTPAGLNGAWSKRFRPFATAMASGWMALRGARRRRAVDRGFILSDHADWNGLNQAIDLSEAERVFVTHGYSHLFSKWLREKGLEAQVVETEFEGETTAGEKGEVE